MVHEIVARPGRNAPNNMMRGFIELPLKRIALWSFLLNMVWEFFQCIFFYDMWGWGFWRATVWMWGAILGDVVIVLGVALVAVLLVGRRHMNPLDRRGWTGLLIVGIIASVALEWLAQVLCLWGYSAWMPTLTVAGYAVGLSPIIQVTLLPVLSVYFATRRKLESVLRNRAGG